MNIPSSVYLYSAFVRAEVFQIRKQHKAPDVSSYHTTILSMQEQAQKNIVEEIDSIVQSNLWFDFHVFSFKQNRLIVAGGKDLTYYHSIEIIFEEVFFVSAIFQGWHSDTKRPIFTERTDSVDMNNKYEIEQGFRVFVFKAEDYNQEMVIAAKSVSYNTDTVYYYPRADLKENERLAN